jgi:hypothetical protein
MPTATEIYGRAHMKNGKRSVGERTEDITGKSSAWLMDNSKKGVRRDEGGKKAIRRVTREMDAAKFFEKSYTQQAAWIVNVYGKGLRDGIAKRIFPYLNEQKARAVGRK